MAAQILSYAEGGTPDGMPEVRRDALEETDGPMLRHGLQEEPGRRLLLPRALESPGSRELVGRFA